MTDYRIEYLADYPEHKEACAAWAYGRWGVQKPEGSFQRALEYFNQCKIVLIAINTSTNLPIAMGSLTKEDGEDWNHLTPWIATIYTHYKYRGQGIAKAIIHKLEKEALKLGHKEVYLYSGSAAGLYKNIGYQEIDSIITTETAAGKKTLFKKNL